MKKIFLTLFIVLITLINARSQTMNVTYKTVTDNSDPSLYTVNATFPQVDFGPEALMGVRGIAQDINNVFDTTVNGVIRDFKSQVTSMPKEAADGNVSSLEITSEAWINNSRLLSSEMATFNNVAGMAHPMTTMTTFNFLDNGSGNLSLESLFKNDSEYLNFISTYCIKNLTANAQKEGYTNINDMILTGAAADLKNFTQWTIKDDSLNIIFNPYQVAPYVFGIQRVLIPLSEMNSMIDPSGPVGYMIR